MQNELYLYVINFINQELNGDEIIILQNAQLPIALNKLFNNIIFIRDFLAKRDIKMGRMGQSYNYFGFTIEEQIFSCWFGYSLPTWSKYQTPIVLQIRIDWIKANTNIIVNKLTEFGFHHDENLEFLYPFPINSIDSWKEDLINLLEDISASSQIFN